MWFYKVAPGAFNSKPVLLEEHHKFRSWKAHFFKRFIGPSAASGATPFRHSILEESPLYCLTDYRAWRVLYVVGFLVGLEPCSVAGLIF